MGVSQIFKSSVPIEVLTNFLQRVCVQEQNAYIFDKSSYKRGNINNAISDLYKECINYYHESKMHYITKTLTYKTLVTVVRQICNVNGIKYDSKMVYSKSKYEIVYFIHLFI